MEIPGRLTPSTVMRDYSSYLTAAVQKWPLAIIMCFIFKTSTAYLTLMQNTSWRWRETIKMVMHKSRATVTSHSRHECTQQPLRSLRTWVTRHTMLVLWFDNNNKKHCVSKTKQNCISLLPPPYAFIGSLQRSKTGEGDLLSKKEDEIATPKKSQRKAARVYRNGELKIHSVRHHSFLETN